MRKRMLEFIRQNQMISSGDRVVVGLSGGADSVCLLALLSELKSTLEIELKAVHVHHGLRGAEADRDAAYAEELSGKLEVPFVVVRCDVRGYAEENGISLEEAGRELRYQTLLRELREFGGTRIAVAHHADDNAETILHNLVRGTGLKGLGGIPPVRGEIIRPMLLFTREEILSYLAERRLAHCEDSTNVKDDYTRNKLRHHVLPLICREVNAGAVGNILRAGALAFEADRYLEKTAGGFLDRYLLTEEGRIGILLSVFSEQEPLVRKYAVRLMLERMAGRRKDIMAVHIEEVCALAEKNVGRRLDLPYGLAAVRTYDGLWIADKSLGQLRGLCLPSPVYTVFPREKGQDFPKNQYTKWFDYDKIKGTLSVRYRRTGDYITLSGGGRKTVKSYMIDEKIPKEMREEIPLLAEGDHVLWIIGYRISEFYKITDSTRSVLQVQIDGGKNDGG